MSLVEPRGREFRDYLSALRRRRGIIVLTVVVVLATTLLLSFLQAKVYEGRARVLLKVRQSLFSAQGASQVGPAEVETEIQVMHSEPVGHAVQQKLGVVPRVSITQVGSTAVIEVAATSTSPRRAAELVNGYVNAYIDLRRTQAADDFQATSQELQGRVDAIQRRLDTLSNQLNGLPACSSAPTAAAACSERETIQRDRDSLLSQQVPLKQRLDQLQVDAAIRDPGVALIAPATPSSSPIQPRPLRNALMALGVGLVIGIALALLFEHLDDSIQTKEDLEQAARDLPVLGMIPAVAAWKNKSDTPLIARAEPSSPVAEAYRTLRTSIQFSAIDRTLRTLQVTSPKASEGKTTTAANLAVVLARAGNEVVVVSCDLRRPRIHEFFGLSSGVGFTSVLLGDVPLSSALQDVPAEERLHLLASGPLPPNPSELLSSSRAIEVLNALAAQYDTVIIDCPPVLPVTDAAVLSARADATLLVATAGSTTSRELSRALELLRQVGAPLVGTVLNGAESDAVYGYEYQYYSQERSANGAGAANTAAAPTTARTSKPETESAVP